MTTPKAYDSPSFRTDHDASELEQLIAQVGRALRQAQPDADGGEGVQGETDTAYLLLSSAVDMALCVRCGLVDQLLAMELPQLVPITPMDDGVHANKIMLASLNAVCTHAAIEGGLSIRTALAISRELVKRIEACTTEEELSQMLGSGSIPMTYCTFVRDMLLPEISDRTIAEAASFIVANYHRKVAVSEVARHVSLSAEYLSAKFRRETGMTITEFVTRLRVREAQILLRYSDLPIVDIAMRLAFSSQSYFQTVFKRETGMTPQEYRLSPVEGTGGS